ncbi:Thiamine-phosphate synthase [Methylobacterium adhaesivum]|jgi:thiamine-phosphate pyrophosphorylase|uniref:Thiamine phosphate synthase n=1 Tax=Methylobacterium adhaesivum TaxID=333297 RepID=A0ABT8BD42_9HYPH|nr:thiamine phosphate synthase [Methylobacterium adhaesivum]MDN3589208.1 thiamine phosphate synthase [Methylobacterium adhaesivum]GJD31941.1 Thiamine-phosphate synthase [Methylobacterium adhaesivum]
MAEPRTRLALLTPHRVEAGDADALAAALTAACAAGDVAAVILRLAPSDERSLVNLVKRIGPAAQGTGAALVVACPGFAGDIVSVSARGGADGVHLDKARDGDLAELRERLDDGRILGAGGHEQKHAAMEAGEAGVDYVMFGGLYADGIAPEAATVLDRAAWWTEIFETPCIAVAHEAGEIDALVATGVEFLGLESALWMGDEADVAAIQAIVTAAGSAA